MMTLNLANNSQISYDRNPDECPICHRKIEPTYLKHNSPGGPGQTARFQIIFRCPSETCGEAFIATYRWSHVAVSQGTSRTYRLWNCAPYKHRENTVEEEIRVLSPDYVLLSSQSSAAEHWKLDQIAGGGYRKALEFLAKDFIILNHPDKSDQIKRMPLGNCIDEYIDDPRIRSCAKLATWLGNDEAHYVRKWEDKDIKDLKTLIRLTESWILTNLLTEKYETDMKGRKEADAASDEKEEEPK